MLTHRTLSRSLTRPHSLIQALLLAIGITLLTAPTTTFAAEESIDDTAATNIESRTFPASEDTYISTAGPDSNFEGQSALQVSSTNQFIRFQRSGLIRFDLTAIPDGSVIRRAELRLYQREANNDWTINIHRIIQDWSAATVTAATEPNSLPYAQNLPAPLATAQYHVWNVTDLVRMWQYQPQATPNYGLKIDGNIDVTANRVFDSLEGENPPQLFVEFSSPPAEVSVPFDRGNITVDGSCDVEIEYQNAARYEYIDRNGATGILYLYQNATHLHVCVIGQPGTFPTRFFGVYLDTDGAQEPFAEQDDISLRIAVEDNTHSSWRGVDNEPGAYESANILGWRALTQMIGDPVSQETAEFLIPLSLVSQTCGAPFGLAIYHESVNDTVETYGWPRNPGPASPATWVMVNLTHSPCPIRVCIEQPVDCNPGVGATVYRTADGRQFGVDAEGYVLERAQIAEGDELWALLPITGTDMFTAYHTSGTPQVVDDAAFAAPPPGQMTLVIDPTKPLVVHDLRVSTQWWLTPAERADLRAKILRASDLIYDFTEAQFILGQVDIYQSYDNWFAANLWTYANNNLRPKATAGGISDAPTQDPDNPDVTYYPGYIHMGSYWNRFHAPPGEPITFEGALVDPSTLDDDWSITMAHEVGHYIFYLFDTYFKINADGSVADVDSCTQSAMGWVYEPSNWAFVDDPTHWATNCNDTHANELLGREEWATIKIHWPWLERPGPTVGISNQIPVTLTQVTFMPPSVPAVLLPNQVMNLDYADNETASRRAKGFIIRNDLVIGQGNPPEGSNQLTLTGAQVGDYLCVYDIDENPPAPNTPRHQYGCETLALGDNTLILEKDESWAPIVELNPASETTIGVTVTQPMDGVPLKARLFPQHETGSVTITLDTDGNVHTGEFNLGDSTPAAYVLVFADEPATETDPRRGGFAMYGIDGGTQPGPSSGNEKAPIYSPDGESVAWPVESTELQENEWISLQTMIETFPVSDNASKVSDAYRLISWPPDLINGNIVTIRYETTDEPVLTAQQVDTVDQDATLAIHYWNGSRWVPVDTQFATEPTGKQIAAATISGSVPYMLIGTTETGKESIYLPYVGRE